MKKARIAPGLFRFADRDAAARRIGHGPARPCADAAHHHAVDFQETGRLSQMDGEVMALQLARRRDVVARLRDTLPIQDSSSRSMVAASVVSAVHHGHRNRPSGDPALERQALAAR